MIRSIVIALALWFAGFELSGPAFAAHILEPIGTEIASTSPRGRTFGQVVYDYARTENANRKNVHRLPIEFEIGLGERTQLNLEAEYLLRETETGNPDRESGIEELGIGIKHRFMDETAWLPDAAFEAEFAPAVGLRGDERALKGVLIASKNLNPSVVLHLNAGYEIETDDLGDSKAAWHYSAAPVIRLVPDRLMLLAEFNGKTVASGDTEATIAPEIIGVFQTETFLRLQNVAFKLAFPFGLNDHSPDFGIQFGISKLF